MEISNRSLFSIIIVIVIVAAVGFFYLNSRIEVSQHPTRDEWLKVYTSYNIHKAIDLWKQRVVVNVDIFSQDDDGKTLVPKEMFITVASANGQERMNSASKNVYMPTVEGAAQSVLENYGITKEYKLIVSNSPNPVS
ncbi:MAG: hypothetical protein HY006_00440 [Candidatus Sungbacteria bacterium]|nr:hypothetical protein [Candidatus Sungbacteria bacterium]